MSAKEKGKSLEQRAASELKSLGWEILFCNKKIFGVEIDIIAKKKSELLFVEVKSWPEAFPVESRWPVQQKYRFLKALESYAIIKKANVFGCLALVGNTKIDFFDSHSNLILDLSK